MLRRDRLTKDEGEHKCTPFIPGSPAHGIPDVPETCVATSTSQETVGGNFDYNWDAVDTNTFYDPPPVCNTNNPAAITCTDIGPTLKTSSYTR